MTKTVLLTGGTGLFGQVLVKHLVANDWKVVTTAREQSRLDRLIASCGNYRDSLIGIVADFNQEGAVARLFESLLAKEVVVTHLVNNARSISSLAVESDGATLPAVFMDEFKMDVLIPYQLTIGLAKASQHSLNCVVNIGSMYGVVAPNPSLYDGDLDRSPIQYGVSKSALHHLTRELAVRLSEKNIRVNCVAFGGVQGRADPSFKGRYSKLVPTGKMLESTEIIGPIEFLLSASSSAVNGHILMADGGWSIW
jgi:hypothetical protein